MTKLIEKNSDKGPFLIVLAAVLWALDGIIRRSLFVLSPITIVFYEHLVGAVVLTPFIFNLFKKEKVEKSSYGWAFLVALLSGLLGTLWFTTALVKVGFISFSVVFLLQKLQPIFATSSASLLLKEKVSKKFLTWASLALIAAYFVTFPGGKVNLDSGPGTIIAALYALGAAFAWGTSTSFSKMLLKKQSYSMATGLRFYLTTLLSFVALLIFGNNDIASSTFGVPIIDAAQLLKFIFIAVSTGMVALLIYYRGLKQTEAKISTILELVFPLLAIFVDKFLYNNQLELSQYFAALILLFSVYKTSKLNISN